MSRARPRLLSRTPAGIRARVAYGAAALALSALAGCASFHVRHDAPPDASLAAYRTFAVVPSAPTAERPVSKDLSDASTRRDLDAAITRELVAKGWQPADATAADLDVRYHGTAQDEGKLEYWGSGGGPYQTPLLTPQPTFTGQLTVEVTEARSGRLVWRGVAAGEASRTSLDQAVAAILQPFPQQGGR